MVVLSQSLCDAESQINRFYLQGVGEAERGESMYKLLIVDDESYSRNGIANFVQREFPGIFQIEKAENGLEGLSLARSIQPELVISDVRMPQMDGLEMCKRLQECVPGAKLIFISAYSELEYYRSALKMHALSFIEKPVVPEEMLSEIRSALLQMKKGNSDTSQETEIDNSELAYVRKVKDYIRQHYADPNLTVLQLANEMHLSKNYIGSLFKKETGVSISSYLNKTRMEKAKELLKNPVNHVSEVGFLVGFDNTDYFTRKFKDYAGMTPSEYRR